MLLNNEWFNNEMKEEITKILKTKGRSEGSTEIKMHSNTGLPKEDRKTSNNQPNPTSSIIKGTTTNKAQSK